MKAVLLRAPIEAVEIQHDGAVLRFDLDYFEDQKGGVFGMDNSPNMVDPFAEINQYWSRLRPTLQQEIFDIYREIRNILDDYSDLRTLQERMRYQLKALMERHQYEDVEFFVQLNVPIIIPADVEEVFDPHSINIIGTRERTYIKEDYRQLVILSIAMRPLGIIWGEYIGIVENEVSNTWKEMNAFYLLLDTWVLDSEPMKRLATYVDANVQAMVEEKGQEALAAAIIAGIGSEDYPRWLLALTVMKRVVFANLNEQDTKRNFISSIYGYIRSKLNNSTSSFRGRVNNKDLESGDASDGGKLSMFESYKSKVDLPLGEVSVIEFVLDNPLVLARQMEPTIPEALVKDFVESARTLLNEQIMDGQVNLLQWLISAHVPVRIVPHLEKSYIVTALAIGASVLWYRGYHSLALLMTSSPAPMEPGSFHLSGDVVPVPKEIQERMETYYPYSRRATHKVPKKKPNPGTLAVTSVHDKLCRYMWKPTLPEHLRTPDLHIQNNGTYIARPDLKLRLVELVININERLQHELPATLSFSNETSL